jgi:hypothetical protein
MKRSLYLILPMIAFVSLLLMASCSKSGSNNSAVTVANISGTYKLSALVYSQGSISINVYDSLPVCEQDNEIILKTDSSATYVDAGTVCAPPEDDNGQWHLSGDSLYLGDNGGKVKSFNGKTLVLVGNPSINGIIDPTTIATTTLIKQ